MALPPPVRVSRLPPIAFPNRLWAGDEAGPAKVLPHIKGMEWPEVALEHVMHLQRLCTESLDNIAFLAQSGAMAQICSLVRLARPNELLVRELLWLLLTCVTRDVQCRSMLQQWSCVMLLADVLYNHYQTEAVLLELARLIWLLAGQYEAVSSSFLSLGVSNVLGHCLSLGYGQATNEAVQLALETLPTVSGPVPETAGLQEMLAMDVSLGDAHAMALLLDLLRHPTLDEATAVASLWCLCQASSHRTSVVWFMLEDRATADKLLEVFRHWGRSPYCLQCIARILQSVAMDSSISRVLGGAGVMEFLLQAYRAQVGKPALLLDALAALLHGVSTNQKAFYELGGVVLALQALQHPPGREHLDEVLHWLPVLQRALEDAPQLAGQFLQCQGLPRVAVWMDEMAWHSQLQLECASLLSDLSKKRSNRPFFLVPPVFQAIRAALQNVGTQSGVNAPLSRCVLHLMEAAPPEWQDALQEVYSLGVATGVLPASNMSSIHEPPLQGKKSRPKSAVGCTVHFMALPKEQQRPFSAAADFERLRDRQLIKSEGATPPVRGPYYFPADPTSPKLIQGWTETTPRDVAGLPRGERASLVTSMRSSQVSLRTEGVDLSFRINALRAASLSSGGSQCPSSRGSVRGQRSLSRPTSAFVKQKPQMDDCSVLAYTPRAPEADEAMVARLTHDLLGEDSDDTPQRPPRPSPRTAVETVETHLLESSGLLVLREAGLQVGGEVLHQVTVLDAVCAARVGGRPTFNPEVDAPRFQAIMADQLTDLLRVAVPAFRISIGSIQSYDGLQTAVEWQCSGLTVEQQRRAADALANLTIDFFAAGLCQPLAIPQPQPTVTAATPLPQGKPQPLDENAFTTGLDWHFPAMANAGEDDGEDDDDDDVDEDNVDDEGEPQPEGSTAQSSAGSQSLRPKSAARGRNRYAVSVVGNERRAHTNGRLSVVVRMSPQASPHSGSPQLPKASSYLEQATASQLARLEEKVLLERQLLEAWWRVEWLRLQELWRAPSSMAEGLPPGLPNLEELSACMQSLPFLETKRSPKTSPTKRQNFSIPTLVHVARPVVDVPPLHHPLHGSARPLFEPSVPPSKPLAVPLRPMSCKPSEGSRCSSNGNGNSVAHAMPSHFRRACSAAETRSRHGHVPPFTS
eukprot:GGOE01001792.1.p1 GENE.GGOE01001792.1~~GGOE01001792.1.p1  ORF type:complete len:1144 (-),score=285.52 GGOE01001792.1:320-3751(-)